MTRFKTIDVDEAKAYDPDGEWIWEGMDDCRSFLLDTKTSKIVFQDGGEPEDFSLGRDLSPLVDLLNEVAEGK